MIYQLKKRKDKQGQAMISRNLNDIWHPLKTETGLNIHN